MEEIELIVAVDHPEGWTEADEAAFQQWLKDNPAEAVKQRKVKVQVQRYNRNPILGLLRNS